MKITILMLALVVSSYTAFAQKYFTKTASVQFFSATPMENIDAKSGQTTSIIDFATGDIVFKMRIKTFQFEKALMQEHFNEKYLESEKYPEATFKGKIDNYTAINLKKEGEYKVAVTGDLTIHGVTKKYTTVGVISVAAGKVSVQAKFPIKLADHDVKIPGAVKDNISETVDVSVNADYTEMVK
jgi:hypothetical protein